MGCAEVISLSEVRASTQWQRLRHELHARFDQWLDRLEQQLPDPQTSLAEVTEAVWKLRQDLTGSLSETIVEQAHAGERTRQYACWPQCGRRLRARPLVPRTVETMVGPVHVERPYFYCTSGCGGVYPFDEAVAFVPGCKQLDVQKAAAQLAIEMPYEEAQTLFSDLTSVQLPVFRAKQGCFQRDRSTHSANSYKEICSLKGSTGGASPCEEGVRLCRKISR